MQKAIIHTNTRVIRRLTTDINPVVGADESVVEVSDTIDLSGGYFKLDENDNKKTATTKDIEDSDVDEGVRGQKRGLKYVALRKSIFDIATDGATPENLTTYFQRLKDLQ